MFFSNSDIYGDKWSEALYPKIEPTSGLVESEATLSWIGCTVSVDKTDSSLEIDSEYEKLMDISSALNNFPLILPNHWWSRLTGEKVRPYNVFKN